MSCANVNATATANANANATATANANVTATQQVAANYLMETVGLGRSLP